MSVWTILLGIAVGGLLGGLLNGLLAEKGIVFPRMEHLPDGRKIWRPGILGNVLTGGVTAVVLAGLYTPLGSVPLVGDTPRNPIYTLTIGGLVGALLSGIGGARLLTNEVNRRFSDVTKEQLAKAAEELVKAQREKNRGNRGS